MKDGMITRDEKMNAGLKSPSGLYSLHGKEWKDELWLNREGRGRKCGLKKMKNTH
jgi:hypothetical protein